MSTESLRFDLARIEAKLDIVLQAVVKQGGGEISGHILDGLKTSELALLRSLTTKQHVALQLVMQGCKNADISDIMGIGENTVKLHVRAVCKKIGVKTRGQAATIASDIFRRCDPREYNNLSGGLPLDWAANLNPEEEDQYAPLYLSPVTTYEGEA